MTKRQVRQLKHTLLHTIGTVFSRALPQLKRSLNHKSFSRLSMKFHVKNGLRLKGITGGVAAVATLAGLLFVAQHITKNIEHQHLVDTLTKQISISKPVTKLIKPSATYTTQEKGYSFAVTKESNTKNPVTFTTKNGSISFASYASANFGDINPTTAQVQDNKTVYQNIYNGVDLIYTNYPDRTLEEYEVKVKRPITQIVQQINTTDVTYQTQPDGSIEFFNKTTGAFSFAVPRPVMYEAQDTRARSYGLHFEVVQANGKTYLVKVIDQKGQQWLQNASYPVMIDATVSLTLFGYESYPSQNNVWQVRLDTVGQGDLDIKTDNTNIQLQSLTCGTQNVNISNGTVPNFTCSDATIATFKVLDNQQHNVTFTYSGFSTTVQSAPNATKPTILTATANPPVVKVGDTITVSSHIIDPVGISSVSADMGGIETIQLNKNSGSPTDGTWQAQWQVHNTATKPYQITITATNTNGQKEVSSVAFFDPYTCTGGGDHAGADWDPATDCPSGFAGTHTNIGTLSVATGETANLSTFDQVSSLGTATISATTVTIASTGKMNADGKGWSGGRGPGTGVAVNGGSGGGSYGGLASSGNAAAGGTVIYGSLTAPGDLGSGGGSSNCSASGAGGGALKITATGTMTVNGTISANGINGAGGGDGSGGSGGSLYLIAGTFAGNGTVTANGGTGIGVACGNGGNGGGGRAAVNYSSANTFSGTFSALNGSGGTGALGTAEPGTAIIVDTTNNDLYINANNTWRANPTNEGQSFTYHAVNVQNSATWTLKGYNTTNTDGVGQTFNVTNFTVASGATVIGTGYAIGAGPGRGTNVNGGSGGGSYGGLATAGSASNGGSTIYGSLTAPVDLGSGSGVNNCGTPTGSGGGAVKINASGTVTVSGTINENGSFGGAGSDDGGGSGGSIWIIAGTFAGNGSVTANGGGATFNGCGTGGNGSGGRIAVNYSSGNTFNGTFSVSGGTGSATTAEVGTAIIVDTTHNDLYINTSNIWRANPTNEGQSFTYHAVTVQNNATWTLKGYNTTNTDGIGQIFTTTNFTVATGATVNLLGTGYAGGASGFTHGSGPGRGFSGGVGGGASYGGLGSGSNNGTYGSATAPLDLGSGGGGGTNCGGVGGAGGGAIKVLATGTMTINGTLTANGGSTTGANAGGSGGSIYIIAGTFTGSGSLTAAGGAGGSACAGGNGGGGRVAIYWGTNTWTGTSTTAAAMTAAGGTGAANGTLTFVQKFIPAISSFNQFQADCTTAVGTGGSVTGTTACIGVTITDGDNPDTETIDFEIEPNATPFTNTPTQTISGVAMTGSPVSRTQTEPVVLGQSYHWQARVTDSLGFTTGWVPRSGNPDFLSQVQPPDSVSATYVSDTSITVSWVYTGAAVDGFDVERSTDGGSYQVINSNVVYPTSSFSDTTATANHEYIYRVRSFLGVNNSVYTTASNVDTTPAAPSSVNVTQPHVGTYTITWADNANDEANYEIQRQIGSGSFVSLSTTLTTNTTTYTDTQIQENQVYTYRVRAIRSTPDVLQSTFGTATGVTPTAAFGKGIYLTSTGRLVLENDVLGSIDIFKNIQNDSTDKTGQDLSYDSTHPSSGPVFPTSTTINDLAVKEGVSQADGKSDVIYAATNNGLFAIHENAATPTSGGIKVYTKDYISELMLGDTRAMWPLDSTFGSGLSDATSHAQTLTNNGVTTFTASGVRGQAAAFNGTNQFLSIADNANLSITGSLTLNAWFKTTSTSTAQTILAKNGSYSLALTASGTVQAQVIGATTATRTSATVINTGWHRATMVYDASAQTLTLYIDGKVDIGSLTGTVPSSITDSAGAFQIGANNGTTLFSGNIDEVTVIANAATASQIANAYQDGYRALQNHTSGKITGVTGADSYQQLLGAGTGGTTVNTVKAVRVDAGNQFLYVGTNDGSGNTGGVSVIGTISDSVLDLYSSINTSKVDSSGNPFAANDIVSIGIAGTPNPASNGQTDVSNTIGVLSFAGTNDTATRIWMESQRFSLAQVLGATTGGGGDSNQVTVNNLLTVGNVLSPTASTSGENILIPAFQINQQGNILSNYIGTDPTGTAYTFTDNVLTSGTTMSLTGSALTSGILFSMSANALTTGTGINASFNGLTSGTGLNLTSSANNFTGNLANIALTGTTNSTGSALNISTAATGNGNKALAITSTGATNGINYGLYSAMTGAATTNIAGFFSSIGATNNYGLIVANGSIGLGTTTPTAFLDIAGSASTSGNLTFRGATNLINAINGGPLNFQTSRGGDAGLTSRFYIANNGNIGIGTTSPANFFDINGLFDVTSLGKVGVNTTAPLATFDIRSVLGTQPTASISGKTSFAGLVVDNSGVGDIFTASSSGLPRFVVAQNGNVGIGTVTPINMLHVASDVAGNYSTVQSATQLILSGSSNTNKELRLAFDTTNNVGVIQASVWGSTTNALLLNPSGGNVGIGVTTASQKLDVSSGIIAAQALNTAIAAGNGFGCGACGGSTTLTLYDNTAGATIFNNTFASAFYDFEKSGVSRLRIDTNGNIGINTSSPLATLDVRGVSGTTPIASFSASTSFAGMVVDNSGNGALFTASTAGTTRFVINNQGLVGIGKAVPTVALDVIGSEALTGNLNVGGYATASASLAVGYSNAIAGIGNGIFSGSVGVGTSNATEKLSVAGAISVYNTTTGRGDIYTIAGLDKTWDTTALFNSAGATFSAGMQNPATGNKLNLKTNFTPPTGWIYRQPVTVNNTTNPLTLTNYQASISANTSTLITGGKMKSDCSDLRITDTDGSTLLPYWIESGCNTTNTVIWTKIPSIPASSNYTIYIYYGNPSATSLSSSTNTFIRTLTNVQGAYRLDESTAIAATDYSGNNYNTNAPTGTTVITGQFNNARSFNGSTDFVQIPNSTSPNLNFSGDMSLEFWVKPGASQGAFADIISKHGTGTAGWVLEQNGTNTNQYYFAWGNGSSYSCASATGLVLTANLWQHVVVSKSGATVTFYVNGSTAGQTACTGAFSAITTTTDNITFGRVGTGTIHFWNGSLDEVHMYNRALTAAEAADLGTTSQYGYVTPNSANNVYVRKFSSPEPVTTLGAESALTYTSGLQSWTSDTMDAGAGNTFLPNFLTVNYTLDGSDNIHPKFQLAASNTSDFSSEVFFPGASSYYQNGTSFPITSGVQQDISTSIANRYRYWKVIAYMDTGATTTDTPTISSIRLEDYHGVSMLASGFFGIGNTAPSARLDVQDNQSATVSAFIRNNNTAGTAGGLAIQLGATTPGAGNEFISFLDGLGEIVGSIQGNGSKGVTYATTGIDFAEYYKKASDAGTLTAGTIVCTTPNGVNACGASGSILGVVSDRAGFAGGSEHAGDPDYVLVGLVGQLPVRVATTSADIQAGDPIATTADGMASKATAAGEIVGHALSTTSDQGADTIMVAINPSWYDPNFYSNVTSGSLMTNFSTSHAFISTLEADTATISDTLTVLGRTNLTDLGVTGSITTGLLSIHGLEGQIQTLAGDLSLQHDRLGGINILNGLVTIDTSGNITTQGVISAQTVNATQFIIKGSTTTGSSIIHQGFTTIEIDSPAMTTQDKVFITPTTLIDVPLTVSTKANGKFIVKMSTPQGQDVTFDWLIIKNKQ